MNLIADVVGRVLDEAPDCEDCNHQMVYSGEKEEKDEKGLYPIIFKCPECGKKRPKIFKLSLEAMT